MNFLREKSGRRKSGESIQTLPCLDSNKVIFLGDYVAYLDFFFLFLNGAKYLLIIVSAVVLFVQLGSFLFLGFAADRLYFHIKQAAVR